MSDNITPGASAPATPGAPAPASETQIVILPTALPGESLTVSGVEMTGEALGCYNRVKEALTASNAPQKVIQLNWVKKLPVIVAVALVLDAVSKNNTVPKALAEHAKSTPDSKKMVVKGRKDHKRTLQRMDRAVIDALYAKGFSLDNIVCSNTVNSKGQLVATAKFKTENAPTAEEVTDTLTHATEAQLEAQLAALKAKKANSGATELVVVSNQS